MSAANNALTLAEKFDGMESLQPINKEIPRHILDNINPNLTLRPYQEKALKRFLYYAEDYTARPTPSHALFEMATGSGKTLVMTALILDLYHRGHRNFMFFVNSTNIIEKTKDNFLNVRASKYLFDEKIIIDDKEVSIRPVANFDEANEDDINIHFTTIQGLHTRLNKPSENAVTYEDFEERKIIMLSDEAHHTNTLTKRTLTPTEGEEIQSWEDTVQRIFKSDTENYLLEFTATAGLDHPAIHKKYHDKILYKYALKEFRIDGYSKEVDVLQADMYPSERAFQAVILSQYRRKIAEKNGLHIKPVILMKSKTIDESKEVEAEFHRYIDNLAPQEIVKVAANSDSVAKRAFDFFLKDTKIAPANLVRELQQDFSREKCLSINSKSESSEKQIQVNTLEDGNNETRVIFVVDMLNEGWDVLNLFDIVRLYDTRDAKSNRPGKTTIKEAQLIGRGARYCPFISPQADKADKPRDMRKYDDDIADEIRILETLYYHCAHNPQYVQEIKTALRKTGIMAGNTREIQLKVKDSFKKTDVYKKQSIFVNNRIENKRKGMFKVTDYLSKTVFTYTRMTTGTTQIQSAFDDGGSKASVIGDARAKALALKDFPKSVLQKAVDQSRFFHFKNIKRYFPKMKAIDVVDFLKEIKVRVHGTPQQVDNLFPQDMLKIALFALGEIETDIKGESHDYEGSIAFKPKPIKDIVQNKTLNIAINNESDQEFGKSWTETRIAGLDHVDLFTKDWFVYEDNFGTDQEKYLIGYISDRADEISEQYDEFYLIRNEKGFKLHAFEDGRALEPDFVLYARKKGEKENTVHQVFIEPKGTHLADGDRWKEDFLKAIEDKAQIVVSEIDGNKYKLIGMPFFNEEKKGHFDKTFKEKL